MHRQQGECTLCQVELSQRDMIDHLPECVEQYRREIGGGDEKGARAYLIAFQSTRAPMYWLAVLAREDATLQQLDAFLRDTWLEGREKTSRFNISDKVFSSDPQKGERPGQMELDLSHPLMDVLDGDKPFEYSYDLDATTEIEGKVVAATDMLPDRPQTPLRMMARNQAPSITCQCGRDAVYVDPSHAGTPAGFVCEVCAADLDTETPEALPRLENTPRALAKV
jgi:hypothetical protein